MCLFPCIANLQDKECFLFNYSEYKFQLLLLNLAEIFKVSLICTTRYSHCKFALEWVNRYGRSWLFENVIFGKWARALNALEMNFCPRSKLSLMCCIRIQESQNSARFNDCLIVFHIIINFFLSSFLYTL